MVLSFIFFFLSEIMESLSACYVGPDLFMNLLFVSLFAIKQQYFGI